MSSFRHHHFYLFSLRGGGKKIAYGRDPKDALEVLALRLTPAERALIVDHDYIKISQRNMRECVGELR